MKNKKLLKFGQLILLILVFIIFIVLAGCGVYDEADVLNKSDSNVTIENNEIISNFTQSIVIFSQNNVAGYHNNELFRKSGVSINNKFLEWFDESFKNTNMTHPYVLCTFNQSCNGNFSLDIRIININDSLIKESLKSHGPISDFLCSDNECYFNIILMNIYDVNNLLNNSNFKDIYYRKIQSDFEFEEIPDNELLFCEKDEDCGKITRNCCGCKRQALNKKYVDYFNNKRAFECQNAICANSYFRHISCLSESRCVSNKCELVPTRELVCESDLFFDCKMNKEIFMAKAEEQNSSLEEIYPNFFEKEPDGFSCNDIIENCNEYYGENFDCTFDMNLVNKCKEALIYERQYAFINESSCEMVLSVCEK